MTTAIYAIRFGGLDREQALILSDVFENAAVPEALSVAAFEIQEHPSIWQVEAHYPDRPDSAALIALAEPAGLHLPAPHVEHLETRDWVTATLKELPPVTAGRFVLYGAHDTDRHRKGGVPLHIDAGTAFGTGHHGTTRGCLLALDSLLKRRRFRRVLDVGCGTGVLGLAAAKALHRPVAATDLDQEAVRVARRTAKINQLSPFFRAYVASGVDHSAVQAAGPYDLILANILARPLMKLSPALTALLAYDGRIILSGLTIDQETMVFARYRAFGLHIERRYRLGNWSTLMLKR